MEEEEEFPSLGNLGRFFQQATGEGGEGQDVEEGQRNVEERSVRSGEKGLLKKHRKGTTRALAGHKGTG